MQCDFSASNVVPPLKSFPRLWPFLALAAIMIIAALVRLRVAPSPFERDEGEYAFMGQLMLQGIPPYTEAANMKFPGTYAAYAIIEAVFGETATGIHYGLLVINLATILLIYHLGYLFFAHRHTAVLAAGIYAVSSLSYSFYGAMAHATHFVVFFGLAGLCLLFTATKWQSTTGFALAGVVTGLAYLSKQSGFYFVPFGCLFILSESGWRLFSPPAFRALAYFIAGAFAPFALTVFTLQHLGCLDNFVFWTFKYASTYWTPLQQAPALLAAHLKYMMLDGWGCLLFVPTLLFFLPLVWRNSPLPKRVLVLLALFLIFSLAGVSLGLAFRNHYWIQVLPAVALLSAAFFNAVAVYLCRPDSRNTSLFASLLCLSCCGAVLIREAPNFFRTAPNDIIRQIYRSNPFVESVFIADYIRQHSDPKDLIYVFGSEPQIYFYAKRHAAASNLYLYSLLTSHQYTEKMQLTVIDEVDKHHPRYFVEAHLVHFPPDIEKQVPFYGWKTAYLANHYHPIFMLDLNYPNDTMIYGIAALTHMSTTGRYFTVWERNL